MTLKGSPLEGRTLLSVCHLILEFSRPGSESTGTIKNQTNPQLQSDISAQFSATEGSTQKRDEGRGQADGRQGHRPLDPPPTCRHSSSQQLRTWSFQGHMTSPPSIRSIKRRSRNLKEMKSMYILRP